MHTLYPGQRVILENPIYQTRVEGTLHSDPSFTHVKTIRLDNGTLFRTEGYLSCANCEYCAYQNGTEQKMENTHPPKSLLQRYRAFMKTRVNNH